MDIVPASRSRISSPGGSPSLDSTPRAAGTRRPQLPPPRHGRAPGRSGPRMRVRAGVKDKTVGGPRFQYRSSTVRWASSAAESSSRSPIVQVAYRRGRMRRQSAQSLDSGLNVAADTMRARLLFNAIVHQYLIPGVQIGAKVISNDTGAVHDVHAVARPVTPESGCLWCNGLINSTKLQEESLSDEERRAQRYVDDPEVVAPSVITLNALAAAQAANDFMFHMTGLAAEDATPDYMRFRPSRREVWWDEPRSSPDCIDCGQSERSRFARGNGQRLPVKHRRVA